ncbi:GntR family transcriptional regulator [Azospirillum lipoferum]|uniref:GntR family transcriptional regulator n=1 Tax=Azospirillum lipoferum TaxID=193 RepID=A0A5A9GQL9_AZOLI|nr:MULTISPECIES: GntR family transcriptional regulator [Azospirillum]KAA0596065.1 GntR family transcriptional regulator [Azospirillum lipoferum]MCP1611001.1 GntR family transcriptional regulator [Azospirillum lipoferum]MDW5533866.1 GntR family transcriptional regulator [Azospirillum sp. NL1]
MNWSKTKVFQTGLQLERDSAVPMYLQLAEAIENGIHNGSLPPGHPLPSEAALCKDLQISRITVRQAIDALIAKQLVDRRQGKGTFVAHHFIRQDAHNADKLFDTLFAQEHAPTSKILAYGPEEPPTDVAAAFGCPSSKPLVRLDRLYVLNGRAVGVGLGWLLSEAQGISAEMAAEHSTAWLIEHALGLKLGQKEMVIRASAAGRSVARLLGIPERSPVLVLHRRRQLIDGRTADFTRFYMNADSYEFSFGEEAAVGGQPALKLFAA